MDRRLFVKFRVSPTERAALDALLAVEQRRVSEVMRELIRREAMALGVWPVREARAREVRQ